MKAKKLNTKMTLKKTTVADLNHEQMHSIKGGYVTVERICLTEVCETLMFPCPTEIYCTTAAPACN